jgi:hypothetical protein
MEYIRCKYEDRELFPKEENDGALAKVPVVSSSFPTRLACGRGLFGTARASTCPLTLPP